MNIAIIIVLVSGFIFFWLWKKNRKAEIDETIARERRYFARLYNGDESQAERLVDLELKKKVESRD